MPQYQEPSHASQQQQNSSSEILNAQAAIFKLIDSVVSLEFCLHYQVLPLELEDNYLTVGMINTKDKTALNFIRPIAASLNYSLEIQSITPQEHQLILAEYLKNSSLGSSAPKNKTSKASRDMSKDTMIDEQMMQAEPSSGVLDSSSTISEMPGQKPPASSSSNNLHERATLIVDGEKSSEENKPQQSQIISSQPQIHRLQSVSEIEGIPETIAVPLGKKSSDSRTESVIETAKESIAAPILELPNQETKNSADNLAALEPKQLWQELLAKILDGGIGRLYLERYPNYGRIIWSRDGVIQLSLDKVKLKVFEYLIREIKTLGKQPLSPLKKPKKVAIERIYHQERILLRLEFLVGQSGDEITIQVLRGEALEFYEQRQIEKSVEQAIYFAEKMEKTLRKIRMCANDHNLEDFNRLEAIYRQIDRQFQLIKKQNNPQK
ncbi:MAG: hypothetical protein AB4372_25505 [Xenococcus sp. (in: cyanobacteria)]